MRGGYSAKAIRDYRLTRGAFALFFAILLAWIVSRFELRGWPLLVAALSGVSVAINFMQMITGPPMKGENDRD